jgi:UDP-N-acetylmuramate: L-alanyl-gamma-D-glutamyl-meso-diaminopimelate ligase
MRLHILGVCGTFMGGLALLARELGFDVTGSDRNAYPPMSTLLGASGVPIVEGYDPAQLDPAPDLLVIGNAFSRGNPVVERALDLGLPYTSGPQFLADHVLPGRWVLAVSGTHGKTTTTSMLAWILEEAGLQPGFLIGGAPKNFAAPARLGQGPFFVVEADEYDSAFFDKRSKFVHYHPRTLIINNLEYDHADIFPDLDAIKRQFHHLVRTVPPSGQIIAPAADAAIADVLRMGCWTPIEWFHRAGDPERREGWQAQPSVDGPGFALSKDGAPRGKIHWSMLGRHNIDNAVAAILAARHAGVPVESSLTALSRFEGVKRRLERRAVTHGISIYDDFAHHPTAISVTLGALRQAIGDQRIIAIVEMRSNTMKMGIHRDQIAPALAEADQVILYQPRDLGWSLQSVADALGPRGRVYEEVQDIVDHVAGHARRGDHILVMSNGGFENIHQRLIEAVDERNAPMPGGTETEARGHGSQ